MVLSVSDNQSREGFRAYDHHRDPLRHEQRKYLGRFVAWDGEGITYPGKQHQSYIAFGNSDGDELVAPPGGELSTTQCLAFLCEYGATHKDTINVVYSVGYDVNMILRDLTQSHLRRLWVKGKSYWYGDNGRLYNIEYRSRKVFKVRETVPCRVCGRARRIETCTQTRCQQCPMSRSMTLWDIWGFFQSTYLVALQSWEVGTKAQHALIADGKASRSSFKPSELEAILTYWRLELALMVTLMEKFRAQLDTVGFKLRRWDGPGAVASFLYKHHGSKLHHNTVASSVQRISQHAYSGGRIEQYAFGNSESVPIYVYDINSAYPAGIAQLPSLVGCDWTEESGDNVEFVPMSLYHLQLSDDIDPSLPSPLWWRAENGSVNYTRGFDGWYWTPEAAASLVLHNSSVRVSSWLRWHGDIHSRPFAWVAEMYNQRKEWKASGNPGERVLKLGLNSLYGKMAQHNGWKPGDKIPPYHQLQWAGYVTSNTRAQLYRAMMTDPSGLIGVETDSIISTKPLPLEIGNELGQWSEKIYQGVTYVQAGVYWLYDSVRDSWDNKSRGFDHGSLSRERVLERWQAFPGHPAGDGWTLSDGTSVSNYADGWTLPVTQTRFIGMGVPLSTGRWDLWRSWHTSAREQSIAPVVGKVRYKRRVPSFATIRAAADSLQSTVIGRDGSGLSEAHKLPWLDGMPAAWSMDEHFVSTAMETDPRIVRAMMECEE